MAGKDNYAKLLRVPKMLSEEMSLLDKNREKALADFNSEKSVITENCDAADYASEEVRDRQKKEAEAGFQTWTDKLNQYKSTSDQIYNRAALIIGKTFGSTEPIRMEEAISMLQNETTERGSRRGRKDDNDELIGLCKYEAALSGTVTQLSSEIKREAESQRDRAIAAAESRYKAEHAVHDAERDYRTRNSERKYTIRKAYEEETFADRVEKIILPDKVREEYRRMQLQQPNYEVFEAAENFPWGIQFGYAGYDVTSLEKDPLKASILKRRFDFALREANGRRYVTMPYGYSFGDSRFSTMFEFLPENRSEAQEHLRNLAINLYMSIPVNKCWCTFIDPVSLGDTFAMFAPMGERDENGKGDERAIDTRIWSSERNIEERLQLLIAHSTDVIQRCLQGRYNDILDYNKDAGINAEPLRFVVIMDFPKHFTDRSLDYLESILENGPKTGVYTLIAGDLKEMQNWPDNSAVGRIRSRIKNTVTADRTTFYVQEKTLEGNMRYFPFTGPTPEQAFRIVKGIRERLGEKIEITYPLISNNLPERPDYWFNKSALDGISVPIGMEGAGKIVNLEFGHPYHSFAAMIGGTTGSGKSTLMHTIIQSVLFNYSPEDVQIYLLDFKQGVEFKCYADYKLPNFRVVSVETEQEFGLAVLDELHKEMIRRSGKFRNAGVENIEKYWRYKGSRGESHADMPRILVIFDEVQALLSDGESDIVKNCCYLIRDLVTMAARAFGMHLILSTQTFENVKGLDNGVYSNIHTRIALKSTKESAELLLNNDNDIASRLTSMDPGQGIFNGNAGDRDANRTFRAAIISNEERDAWMQKVYERQMEVMMEQPKKPRILLSGPEDDSDNPLSVFAATGERPDHTGDPSYHLYIGESLTMINTYLPSLWSESGSNFMIAGRDTENAGLSRMVVGYSVLSLLYETIRLKGSITEPIFTVFDLSGSSLYGSGEMDMLHYIEQFVPEAFRIVPPNQILNGIQTLYQELPSGRRQFVIFYGLNRAKQLTSGTYQRSPKEVMEQMFSKGPESGMNFIVWANDPGLLIEHYGMSLHSFDNRLAYGMEDKEYKTITGENGPKYSSQMNATSYNPIGDNQKIRLYKRPTENWLRQFLMNVRKYVN